MNIDAVTVRPMQPDEIEIVAQLRATGFNSTPEKAINYIKNNPRYNSSHIIIAEHAGQLIGTATLFPAKMWLSGVPLNIGAVAAITVLPEFQRNGVATKLMESAIYRASDEGQAISLLYPFSHKYYRKFGYGTVSDLHAYRIDKNNIAINEKSPKVRPFTAADLPILRVQYKGQLTWRNGWFTRSNEWWDKLIVEWSNIMVYDDDDRPSGYYAYKIKEDEAGKPVLHITEIFYADAAAFRGLLSHLAQQNEAEIIEYLAPADTPLRHCLHQPIATDAKNRGWVFNDLCHVTPGPMARIINLAKALTSRFYTRGMSGERIIKITDPLIPANEEIISFRLVDGRAETHPAPAEKPHIETDIVTLTQILCDYMKAMDAYRLGRFKTNEDTCSWFDKIIVDTPLFIQAGDWF